MKTDAILCLLASKKLITVDELRRGIETLSGQESMSYYERWNLSLINILQERKLLSRKEIEEKLGINDSQYSTEVKA